MSAHDHKRVTPEGRTLGEQLVRLTEPVIKRLEQEGEPDERCKTCAFRAGTVPNGCPQTTLDVVKCIVENRMFACHCDKTHRTVCHGWYAARVAMQGRTGKMPYDYSPSDEEVEA